jgi:hypothetical protein
MKTRLVVLIGVIFVLILSVMASAQGKAAYRLESEVPANFNGLGSTAYSMREEDTVGIQFSLAKDALFVGVGCPSWTDNFGELTFKLYKFVKDYATTVKGSPIITHTFVDYIDNAYLGFEFTEDNPLKAGEYVIEISDASDDIGLGVGIWTTQKYPGQNLFEDGVYNNSLAARMHVKFKGEAPETPYGELTPVKEENGEVNESPYPFPGAVMRFSDSDADSYYTMSGARYIDEMTIENGILKIPVQSGNDPQFIIDIQASLEPVPCDEYPIMLIRLKRPEGSPLTGEIMFNTTDFPGPVLGASVGVTYEDTTEWQDVIVDLSANKNYKGELLTFRYDIVHMSDKEYLFEIEYILFFGTVEAARNFDMSTLPTPSPTPESTPTPEKTSVPAKTETAATQSPRNEEKGGTNNDVILGVAAAVSAVSAVVVVVIVARKRR